MGLRNKIIIGSTFLTLFVVMSLVILFGHWRDVEWLIDHILTEEQPSLVIVNNLDSQLHHTTASLNIYLVTADEKDLKNFVKERDELKSILASFSGHPIELLIDQPMMERLQQTVERYLEYSERLAKLRLKPMENYSALNYAREHIHPLHQHYMDVLQKLLVRVKESGLRESLYELRLNWLNIGLSYRFYISERDSKRLDAIRILLAENRHLLETLIGRNPAIRQELLGLKATLEQRETLLPNVERLVSSDAWRQDVYLLKNYLLPRVEELEQQLHEIINAVVMHTEYDSHSLIDKIGSHRSTIELLLSLAVFAVLVTLLSLWRWLSPIRDFVEEVNHTDLDAPEVLSGNMTSRQDELGELARSYNNLMLRLRLHQQRQQAVELDLRLAATTFESNDGIAVTDASATILRVNRAFTRITGYRQEDVVGKNPRILASGVHDREYYRLMWRDISMKGYWEGEIWNRKKSGERYPEWLSITAVYGNNGKVTHYVAHFRDLTQRKKSVERLHRRMRLEKAISSVAIRCMRTERLDDERHIIATTLMELGNVLGVDYCFFSGLSGGYEEMGCTQTWSIDGKSHPVRELNDVIVNECPATITQLYQGKMVLIENVMSLHNLEEKEKMHDLGVQSIALIPLDEGDGLYGYFAFVTTEQLHEWLGGDVQLLTLVAEVFLTTKHRHRIDALRAQSERQALELLEENRRLVQYNLALQEVERRKLAQELHDEMGQLVIGIKMDAGFIRTMSSGQPKMLEVADDIEKLSSQLIDLMRLATRRLRTATLDHLGLVSALEETVFDWCDRQPDIDCYFHVVGEHEGYSEEVNVMLYRVVQESLTNIAKHAKASRVDVALERLLPADGIGPGIVRLWIEDDGVGFDINQRSGEGLGIFGMAERVDSISGRFILYGCADEGTTTLVELPLVE